VKRVLYILLILLTSLRFFGQQDQQISHYFFMKTFYNPSYTGYEGEICANFLSHQQWRNFENAPFTNILTIDAPVSPFGLDAGVGANFVDDRYGYVHDFKANLDLAFNYDFGFGPIRFGLSPGIFSKKYEPTWKFPDQPETILDQDKNVTVFDIEAGLFYTVHNLFVGISSFHLLTPAFKFESTSGNETKILTVNHYYLMAGYEFQTANSAFEVTPSVFLKSDGNSVQYDINIFALYNKKIWVSVSYRNKDALAFFVGTSYFNNIRLGLSYDVTLSYLNRVSNGTLEAYVGYNFSFFKPANAQKYRNVKTL